MLCGVTATQGSNPCATAFRLVAPTDVGATSFLFGSLDSVLGARDLGVIGVIGHWGYRTPRLAGRVTFRLCRAGKLLFKNTLTRQLTGNLSIVTDESEKTMLQERLNNSTLPGEVKETLSPVIESARTLEETRAQLARAQRETNDANARLDQMLHLESAARDEETLARHQSEHTDQEASLGLASQEEKDAMRTRADMATTAAQDATGDVDDARAQVSHTTTREAQAQAHYVGTAQTQTSVRITKESFPTSALKGLRALLGKKTTVSATPRPRPRTQSTGRSR